MASTKISLQMRSGRAGWKVQLFTSLGGSIQNTAGGDTLSEDSTVKTVYIATVTQAVAGSLIYAIIVDGAGVYRGTFVIYDLADDTNTYPCQEQTASNRLAPLTAAGTRSAMGLGSANLDTQLGDLPTNAEAQAMFDALNQSASRRVTVATSAQFERPESGSVTYTIEVRTYNGDGEPTNATGTPTVTVTGIVSGSLAANLGAGSNPATGVYRYIYTVASDATIEQIRVDASAAMPDGTFSVATYPQICDFVAATFTTADRATIEGTKAKTDNLPSSPIVHTLGKLWAFDSNGNAVASASELSDANEALIDLINLAEADEYIDISQTPWQLVFIQKGTGDLDTGVVLKRKDLKSKDGVDLISESTFVGQLVEP